MLGKICRASRTVSPRWPILPRTALRTENIIIFLLLSVGRESFRWICSRDSSPLSWPVSGISLKSKNASAMNLVLRKSLSFTWNTKIAPSVFRCSVVRGLKKYHDKQVFFCVKKFIRIIIGRMILCVFFFWKIQYTYMLKVSSNKGKSVSFCTCVLGSLVSLNFSSGSNLTFT